MKPIIMNIAQKWLLLTYLLCGSVGAVFGQGQCANGTLNVNLNTPANLAACSPYPRNVTFNNTSGTGSAQATSYYLWYVDGVFIDSVLGESASRIFNFTSVGTHTVRVVGRTAGGGCLDTITRTVSVLSSLAGIVDPPRITTPTLNPVWTGCNTNPSNPSNLFTINVRTQGTDTLKNYTIIWGDTGANTTGMSSPPGNIISHTYGTLGVFTVTIINNNGTCIDTIRGTVRNLRPVSTSILPLPAGQLAGCAPHTITFQDSTQNAFPGSVITWNFGTGQATVVRDYTQANTPIAYTYPKAASQQCIFAVSITATNTNCPSPGPPSTYSVSPILIYDVDVADVAVATPLCDSTRSVTLLNNSQLNCEPGQRYWYWDFGDGTNTGWITTQASQVHVYPTFGDYTVMLIDSNFCGTDTDYLQIRVNRIPKTGFTANPKQGCAPLNVSYADTSGGVAITSRTWTFGTGSGIANRSDSANSVIYTVPGNYRIRLTATNECGTVSANDSIHVYAKPSVRIRSGPNGCAPFTRTFLDSTINQSPAATYKWTFGNGDSSALRNPNPVTYNTPASYIVKLVVTDSCGVDSFQTTVVVSSVPTADFTADTVCRGDSTTFTNSSVLAMGDNIFAAKWYFGDGDSSSLVNPKHRYTADGTKTVVLRIQTDKGCIDFDTLNTVFVNTSPNVAIGSPNRVCDGSVVTFDGTATPGAGIITAYQWTFGSGIPDTARIEDTSYLYPGPGTYTVRYKVSNSTGCSFTETKNITIDPIPDSRPTVSNLCFAQRAQFRDSSTVSNANTITQWQWDFNDDGIADSTTQHPTFLFPSANTFKIKLRVGTNNNCFNTDSIDIVIRPLPVASINHNGTSKCKLDTFVFSNTSTGASSYTWRFGDGSADSTTASSANLEKVYQDSGTFAVRMIAVTSFGCLDTASFSVNSRPFPIARYTVNDSISCAPKNFVFTNTSLLANNYVWRVNGLQTTTALNRPDTFIATSGQSFVVSLIATNVFGCRPDTTQKTIQTITNPSPDFIMSTDSGCGPLVVNFTNATMGASSYLWQFGNGSSSAATDTLATYVASNLNDSSYTVKLIAFNGPGCKDSISKVITVFPKPISSFNQNETANCGPLPVSFTNTSVHKFGGTINDLSFHWNLGNGNIASAKDTTETFFASGIQDTNYTVSLVVTTVFGCRDTSSSSVKVYPDPRSSFTVNHDNGCGPLSVNFSNTSVPHDTGSIGIMTFDWDFKNGLTTSAVNPSSSFIANLTKDTVYEVQLIAYSEHGCKDTSFHKILVYPKPLADFTMPQDSGCTPFNAVFINTSTPYDTGDISMMSFIWNLGNGFGNVTQDAFGQYVSQAYADSSYSVKLFATSEHGCRDTAEKRVVAHPLPVASFINDVSQGCGPVNVQFTNYALLAATYKWDFGDGSTSVLPSPTHAFQSYPLFDSIYNVSFSVQSAFGCASDTVTGNIIARYLPVADFAVGADSICSSGNIALTNQSIGGIGNNWNFGNGNTSISINPVANFTGLPDRDTTYTIRLVVRTPYSCRDTAYGQVKVNPLPEALFSPVVPDCTPLPVTFQNTSLRGVSYEWDFGDGTEDSVLNPSKIFNNDVQLTTRNFQVTLKAISQSGCTDTAKHIVTVYSKPKAAFTASTVQGCGPLAVSYTNQSASNFSGSIGMTFDWQFGNGDTSTQATPSVSYLPNDTKDTIYRVQLTTISEFGCRDTAYNIIKVYPKPQAQFTVNDSINCGPITVQFTNSSYPKDTGSINIMSFVWDFANGSNSVLRNPISQFINNTINDTTFAVKLYASSEHGCRDTAVKNITVKPKPIASFTQDKISACGPFTVNFTNTSQISTQQFWHFGDGDTSTTTSPSHVYQSFALVDSLYTTSLVTQSAFGCVSDTIRRVITARYLPVADFNTSADTVCNPGSISFFNASVGGSANSWNFGNGNTANSVNPVAVFNGPLATDTNYMTRLVVTSPGSCRDTVYKRINVQPAPDASFANITPGCTPLSATMLNTSQRGTTYEWDFGDGTTDHIANPSKTFTGNVQLANTNYLVTLKVYSAFGCLDTAKRIATVYPLPVANYTSNFVEGCGPLAIAFNNQSAADFLGSPGITFDWNFGNGDSSIIRHPSTLYLSNATKDTVYHTRLIATSVFGCKDTTENTIRVFPKPKAQYVSNISSGCTPLTVAFTNQSYPNDTGNIDMMSFVWSYANGLNAVTKDGASEFTNNTLTDTIFKVKLFASSEHGCRDTAIQNILVHPKPTASFTQNKTSDCGPFSVNFTSTSQLSTVFKWHFGDGDSAQTNNPSHVFQSYPLIDSFYSTTLVTQSAFGCVSDTARRTIIGRYLPQASFITSADSTCNPGSISFFNTSVGGSSNSWNFGNGNNSGSINPVVTFSGPITKDTIYTTRLIVTSPGLCKDTVYKNIKVNPAPDASFSSIPPACTPHPVLLNNTSQRAATYEWDFGDGTISNATNPSKNFENTVALVNRNYTVVLTAYSASGCSDTAKRIVTTFPLPLVNFTTNKTLNCDTAEYATINSTQGGATYLWRQGNVNISPQFAPLLYFNTLPNRDTTYIVSLIATSASGCKDTLTKPISVKPLVRANFNSTGTSSCSNLNVLFDNQSANGLSYFWLFGDGTGSPLASPEHRYTNTGSYHVALIAYDAFGCSDTALKTNNVNIYEVPSANFLYSPPDAALPNSTISFNNLSFVSSGTLAHQWTFGDFNSDPNSSILEHPSHTFSDSGNFVVRLVVNTVNNCFDTMEQVVRIRPHPPVPDFTLNPPQGCSPLTVQFTNQSQFADAYEWTFDDGQKSTAKDPVVTFKFPGKYGAFLRASGPGGISQIRKDEIVEVYGLPRANFFATPVNLIIPNSTVSLTDISSDAVKWKWQIGLDGFIYFEDSATNAQYTFTEEGKFTVKLIVQSKDGCLDSLTRPQFINVIKGGKSYIGNAFTPNGDGTNDVFKPYLEGVVSTDYLFEIFNRWGQKVFSTNNVNTGWDGTYNGAPATVDSYVWKVQGKYVGNIDFDSSGMVTLLR